MAPPMGALLRAEALQPGAVRWVGSSGGRLTFVKVFFWAQILMVVANLGRIPVLSTSERDFPLAFNEICLGVMLFAALLTVRSWRSVRLDGIALTALVFALIGGGSAVWSIQRFDLNALELFVSLSFLARWLMYFALYVAIINVVKDRDIETLWLAVETMLVVFAIFGIFQAAFLPGFAQMVYHDNRSFNWDEQGHRLVSTVLEPNLAGALLMIGFLVQMSRVSTGAEVRWWKLAVVLAALILTVSRSAAVGLLFGLPVILAARGLSRRLVRTSAVIAVPVLLCSPLIIQYAISYGKFTFGAGSSAAARVTSWLQAIQVIGDHPIFGIGFNAYRYAVDHYGFELAGAASYGVDGGLLFIMAMTGIVGLVVYCFMLWQVIARCRVIWRDRTSTASERGIAIGAASATVAAVAASAFMNAILTTFVMEILWVLWALTFVMVRARRDRSAARPTSPSAIVALAA